MLKKCIIAIHLVCFLKKNMNNTKQICPVCGQPTIENLYDICSWCEWEYDGITNIDEYSSANKTTISKYRKKYSKNLTTTEIELDLSPIVGQ